MIIYVSCAGSAGEGAAATECGKKSLVPCCPDLPEDGD